MLRTGQAGNWSSSLGAPTDALTLRTRGAKSPMQDPVCRAKVMHATITASGI